MKVYVKLFATLRPYHPGPNRSTPLEVSLPEGALAADLAPALGLPDKLIRHAFINNQQKTLDTPLSEGDVVNLFPPVVGGSKAAAGGSTSAAGRSKADQGSD